MGEKERKRETPEGEEKSYQRERRRPCEV